MLVSTVVCVEFWNKSGTLPACALYVDKPGEGRWRPQQAYRVRREECGVSIQLRGCARRSRDFEPRESGDGGKREQGDSGRQSRQGSGDPAYPGRTTDRQSE